jgi:hypothetical protein
VKDILVVLQQTDVDDEPVENKVQIALHVIIAN